MKRLSGLSASLMSRTVEGSMQAPCKTGYCYCGGFINWIYSFKMIHGWKELALLWSWWADVYRNSLLSGKKKKKGLFDPTQTATLAWLLQNLGIWVLLYISQLQFYKLPSVRLSSPASPSAGEGCSQRSIMWGLHSHTVLGLGPSSLKPISHLQNSVFSCLFLWTPLPPWPPHASFCLGLWLCFRVISVTEVGSWFAFSMRESDLFWHSVK